MVDFANILFDCYNVPKLQVQDSESELERQEELRRKLAEAEAQLAELNRTMTLVEETISQKTVSMSDMSPDTLSDLDKQAQMLRVGD